MVRTICPSPPMRMKALGVKPSASAASASPCGERQAQAQQQAAAGGRSGLQEPAPGESVRGPGFDRFGEAGSDAIEDHCRTPSSVDCAARLIASRMRT